MIVKKKRSQNTSYCLNRVVTKAGLTVHCKPSAMYFLSSNLSWWHHSRRRSMSTWIKHKSAAMMSLVVFFLEIVPNKSGYYTIGLNITLILRIIILRVSFCSDIWYCNILAYYLDS